jgi:DNA repair protein SbcC/Rad50
MKVTFKNLKVTNFKGCQSLEINFSDETNIKGKNESGKTTILDAITWCLFGKNSQNETKFSIKNTVFTELNRADHVVEMVIEVDGVEHTAKRIYREKWTKKRGEEFPTYDSNESELFWNNVPVKASEFTSKVNAIIEESLFKLLTNPLYFNVHMDEKNRRDRIVSMAGEVTEEKVINGTPAYRELMESIKGQKSLEEYRKEINYQKLGIKKAMEAIPARIDEVLRSNTILDWAMLEKNIADFEKNVREIDQETEGILQSVEKENEDIQKFYDERRNALLKMAEIESDIRTRDANDVVKANEEINKSEYEYNQTILEISRINARIQSNSRLLQGYIEQLETLGQEWDKENAREFVFDPSSANCSQCGQRLPSSSVSGLEESLRTSFNQIKSQNLSQNTSRGQIAKENKEAVEKEISGDNERLVILEQKKSSLFVNANLPKAKPTENLAELVQKNAEWIRQKAIAVKPVPEKKVADFSDLKSRKTNLVNEINSNKILLAKREQLERNNKRVEELKAEEKVHASDFARLEKIEFTIESFQKKRMEMIEHSVNHKFSFVKFKLFESQVNGGEKQVFETLVHGVPYSDANRAGQINAGIDIINALSGHYGITAPIIIDNAEAVNEFIPTTAQTIKLYVSTDKQLVIA